MITKEDWRYNNGEN